MRVSNIHDNVAHGVFMNGEYVASNSSDRLDVVNPSTGQRVGTIVEADGHDVSRAVACAQEALGGKWGSLAPSERARMLHALADAIENRAEELAQAEVRDNGKVIREMRAQMSALPKWYRYFAGLADKLQGHTVPMDKRSLFNYTVREPLGVIGCITPWNSPLLLGTWKMAPALAAGNTVVVKPSEHASVSTLMFAQCFQDADFPPGVFNVVTGGGASTGSLLARNPLVERVSFTGSAAGGREVAKAASARFAEVTLELGGKSPNILFADAQIEAAVSGILSGIFAAAGQTCVAGARAIIHRSIHDEILSKLLQRATTIRVGDPLDETTEMGPIANAPQFEKVQEYARVGIGEGADLLTGGAAAYGGGQGFFFPPTIFGGVTANMRIFREEVFGPVLTVTPFDTEEEAIALANDTDYGLAAGLWTSSSSIAHRVSARLHAGTVWVNTFRAVAHNMPFGGYKDSGIGRENGLTAIDDYVRTKSVWIETEPTAQDPFSLKV